MRVLSLSLVAIAVLAGAAGVAEHRGFVAGRQVAMGVVNPAKVKLEPVPIRPDWIIEGTPRTLAAEIAHTDDGTTRVYVWQTTAACFHWNYDADEIVQILDGEVFVADTTHDERRLGPGDVAFFPAGAETLWRVPDHLRKIATLRSPVPGPFADVIRWLRAAKHWDGPPRRSQRASPSSIAGIVAASSARAGRTRSALEPPGRRTRAGTTRQRAADGACEGAGARRY